MPSHLAMMKTKGLERAEKVVSRISSKQKIEV
jgi:hypothetical protein